jgi:hypothetical protein
MVRRSVSFAARTCSVCSFFARGLLCWSEPAGGELDRLDVLDPFGDPVSVKVAFFTLVALIGIPSSSGWISLTSTIGTGSLSLSEASDGLRKSGVETLGPFGDLGELRSRILGAAMGNEELPFRATCPLLWIPGGEALSDESELLGLIRDVP